MKAKPPVRTADETASSSIRDFGFITRNAKVVAHLDLWWAMEIAVLGAGDQERELGEDLVELIERRGGSLCVEAIVRFPPSGDPARGHMGAAALEIPELDSSGDLFTVRLELIHPAPDC